GKGGEEDVGALTRMRISLAYLKSRTQKGWEVDIIDEMKEPALTADGTGITFDGADLVGITAMSHQAPRAYRIATACRAQGIPVAIGGWHATSYPEEARPLAGAVRPPEAFPPCPR